MAGNKPSNKRQADNRERDPQVVGLRMPPHSIEAEQSVLGSLMLDNERWDDVTERVAADDFYTHPHRHILTEMTCLQESGSPINLITLAESLERQGQLDSVDDFACLVKLSKNTPGAANINAYADIVYRRAVIRETTSVTNKIAEAGFDPQGHTSENLLGLAESRVFGVAESRVDKDEGPENIADILDVIMAYVEQLFQQPHNDTAGVNTGYDDLNKRTVGLQPSDLIIVAARLPMGKTIFATNLVENTAVLQDKPVLIFSLGMPSEQIMMRSLALLPCVDQTKIRAGWLNDKSWARISGTMGVLLEKCNIYIGNPPGLMSAEVRSRVRRIAREHGGIGLIMIDHLQLMRVPALSDNRTLGIAEISRLLRALAKELNVPAVVLSQLNRSLEQRTGKHLVDSGLCESGFIERDADLIMFTYHDEAYHEDSDLKGTAEIIIGKRRNSPIGTVRLTFNGQWSRFDNYAGP